jgi:hypothetical protein
MRRNEDGVTMVQSFEEIMAEWEAANGAHQEPLEIVRASYAGGSGTTATARTHRGIRDGPAVP